MIGTMINAIAIVAGGLIGSLLGTRLPEKTRETVLSGLGLVTLIVGLQMALTTRNVLIVLGSLIAGAVLGEWWGIEAALGRVGKRLESRLGGPPPLSGAEAPKKTQRSIARGFFTASLVFCVGPIAIIGSIQDGLMGDHRLLVIKSALDFVGSIAFSAVLGPGVILAALSVLVYQGAIGLAAIGFVGALGHVTNSNPAVIEMTATGGVLIMGIGLVLLDLRPVRVGNMLPAVAIAPAAVVVLRALGVHV